MPPLIRAIFRFRYMRVDFSQSARGPSQSESTGGVQGFPTYMGNTGSQPHDRRSMKPLCWRRSPSLTVFVFACAWIFGRGSAAELGAADDSGRGYMPLPLLHAGGLASRPA